MTAFFVVHHTDRHKSLYTVAENVRKREHKYHENSYTRSTDKSYTYFTELWIKNNETYGL